MQYFGLAAASIALCAASVQAAPAEPPADSALEAAEDTAPAPVDPERLVLARMLVAAMYPSTGYDAASIAEMREAYALMFEELEDPQAKARFTKMVDSAVERMGPIIEQQTPSIIEAYARAYARQFSAQELRDITAFAQSPAGARFLESGDFAEADEDVLQAQESMMEQLWPMMDELQTAMCQHATQVRIAAGETDAKCSRA